MLKAWSSIWNPTLGGGTFSRWLTSGRILSHMYMRGSIFKGMLRSFPSLSVSYSPRGELTNFHHFVKAGDQRAVN